MFYVLLDFHKLLTLPWEVLSACVNHIVVLILLVASKSNCKQSKLFLIQAHITFNFKFLQFSVKSKVLLTSGFRFHCTIIIDLTPWKACTYRCSHAFHVVQFEFINGKIFTIFIAHTSLVCFVIWFYFYGSRALTYHSETWLRMVCDVAAWCGSNPLILQVKHRVSSSIGWFVGAKSALQTSHRPEAKLRENIDQTCCGGMSWSDANGGWLGVEWNFPHTWHSARLHRKHLSSAMREKKSFGKQKNFLVSSFMLFFFVCAKRLKKFSAGRWKMEKHLRNGKFFRFRFFLIALAQRVMSSMRTLFFLSGKWNARERAPSSMCSMFSGWS